MDESALERYFDNFIVNDSQREEELKEDEMFPSLLPDELLTLNNTAENESRTSLNYSSQNATVSGASSLLEPGGSSTGPPAPEMPVIHVEELPETIPQIQNVIASVKLGCRLDLDVIAQKAWNVEYNPKTYKALIMRIRQPRTSALIYESGNIVCTGAKSEEQSRLATRRFARRLQRLGFPVSFLDFKVQNVVASCSIFPVSLEQLMLVHHQHCSYEPELFPGLFYSVMPGVTVTIFPSGKMAFTGAKTSAEINKAFEIIYPILSSFRR